MKMSGAEMLLECMKKERVSQIFGYPGGVVLPIFDSLYKDPSLSVVLTRHEQGRSMRRKGMPVRPARWASSSSLPVPEPRTP